MFRLNKPFLLLHVALPVLAGGLIYVCWRDPGLLMFQWFRALHCEPLVLQLRLLTVAVRPTLPFWFVYSLPDGLWVYALTAFMAHVWSGSRASVTKIACLAAGPLLGGGSELGQLARLVPGSFDWTDFVFYLLAAGIAFIVGFRSNTSSNQRRSINEQPNKAYFAFTNRIGDFSTAGLRQRVLDEQE